MTDGLARLDATASADLVRRGEVTPGELVEAAVHRCEAVNPALNAVIHPRFDRATAEAAGALPDGPFRGVPLLVKDALCAMAGEPHHQGLRPLRDQGWRAPVDSDLAARFRRAGFVTLGRTNVPELCLSTTTEPLAYGPSRNPWNLGRSTGGSSGGSAAAVAAGVVAAAHGNDAGGSIRIPASACGLVGLKPTRGRTSFGPDVGGSWAGFNHEHVLTRSVRDSAAVLDAIAGSAIGDLYTAPEPGGRWAVEAGAEPGRLRIGVLAASPTAPADDQVVAGVRATAALLDALGHDVVEAHPPALDEFPPYVIVLPVVAARHVQLWGEVIGRQIALDELEPFTAFMVELGQGVSAVDLLAAQDATESWGRRVQGWWADGHDILLTPTMPVLPPEIGALGPTVDHEALAEGLGALSSITMPFDATGQPAISLPLHWTADDLPVGMHLVAAHGREDLLFRLAAQLEQARPWADRTPPVWSG